jgi:hypothetical protein
MPRIGRYILNTLTVLSLAACLAAVAIWILSSTSQVRWRREFWTLNRRGYVVVHGLFYGFSRGTLYFGKDTAELSKPTGWYPELGERRYFDRRSTHESPLFWVIDSSRGQWASMDTRKQNRFVFQRSEGASVGILLGIPLWWIAAPFALLPLWGGSRLLHAYRATRRLDAGRCPKCGYDLRATPSRCPECGTIPKTQASPLP